MSNFCKTIKFCFTSKEARKIYNNKPPLYANDGDQGFDLRCVEVETKYSKDAAVSYLSAITNYITLKASVIAWSIFSHRRVLIKTGIKIIIPHIENQLIGLDIRSRSGLALKQGLMVLNGVGTVDRDYRDELGVILYNSDLSNQEIKIGDRIAQGVFNPLFQANFEEISLEEFESLSLDKRNGGFGSTGKS
jgi:dUTP pyrophosphatase